MGEIEYNREQRKQEIPERENFEKKRYCCSDLIGARESGRKFPRIKKNKIPFCYLSFELELPSPYIFTSYSLIKELFVAFSTHFRLIFSSRDL